MVNPTGDLKTWPGMRIEHLYRYPVKGLSAEALEAIGIEEGECIPWDRAFALAQGDAAFDPAAPHWLPKSNFMCQMKNARIAALRAGFQPASGTLTIRAPDGAEIAENALTEAGRARIGAFLTGFLDGEARGAPRFHHIPGHSFCDQRTKVVSLISLGSLAEFEARIGARRHKRRFRANIYYSGAPPWAELGWIGRELQVGRTRLACRAADHPLPGDRGQSGDGRARRGPGERTPRPLRAYQSRRACPGDRGRHHRHRRCDRGAARLTSDRPSGARA